MLDESTASTELAATLGRVEADLGLGDIDGANVAMAAAADLCRRLQAAGLGVPAGQLDALRDLADRCGTALVHLGQELNAACFRDDNLRRAVRTYNGDSGR